MEAFDGLLGLPCEYIKISSSDYNYYYDDYPEPTPMYGNVY
jgi:hypothetical protein